MSFLNNRPALLLAPWIFLIPFLFFQEIKKLNFPATWTLSTEERQNHFLKIALEGLEEDYFHWILEAQKIIRQQPIYYGIRINPNLSPEIKTWVYSYTVYALCPAKQTDNESLQTLCLYYRTPSKKNETLIAIIPSLIPSYLVSKK